MMDPSDIVEELLTCNICENVGFQKGTTLLLLPKCQHYMCATCMQTMRERASANNETTIECPFCRLTYSASDEHLIPRFRYAACLANKLLLEGKNKKSKKPVAATKDIHKPVLLKELDITNAQIIRFMQFGDGTDLYTSAGALSQEFPGIYMMELGSDKVRHFGVKDCKYDGLAFADEKLFALNYTNWTLDIYDIRSDHQKWPQLLASCALLSCRPKTRTIEQRVTLYRSSEGLHVVCADDCFLFQLSDNGIVKARHERAKNSYNTRYPIFASTTEKWYMEGDHMVQQHENSQRKNSRVVLTNWISVTHYESKKILYTVKESTNIFIMDTIQPIKEQTLPRNGSHKQSRQHNPKQLFINTMGYVPVSIAASHGYIAMLGHQNGKKVLKLYACQKTSVNKTELLRDNFVEQTDENTSSTSSASTPSSVMQKALDTVISLFRLIMLIILWSLLNLLMSNMITKLGNFLHKELGYTEKLLVVSLFIIKNISIVLTFSFACNILGWGDQSFRILKAVSKHMDVSSQNFRCKHILYVLSTCMSLVIIILWSSHQHVQMLRLSKFSVRTPKYTTNLCCNSLLSLASPHMNLK